MNLKKVLMELGNHLVTNRHYLPASVIPRTKSTIPSGVGTVVEASLLIRVHPKSTEMIARFTEWLNDNSDAQEILKEMGVEWPT